MNELVLGVAGGRKTQSIVDRCANQEPGHRTLVLTYTMLNQSELAHRLAVKPISIHAHVQGWFSFLLNHWVKPYLPQHFAGRRLRGLNFDGDPGRYATGVERFLDQQGRAYKLHLAQLAYDTNTASAGAAIDRLARIYDDILIDEIQDLNGYDLEILEALLKSSLPIYLVGDIRQALIMTNVQDPKNKQFKGPNIGGWFTQQQRAGRLTIGSESTTWRSNQLIADFADSIFPSSAGFPKTQSQNSETTDHDGIFSIATEDVNAYVERYRPLCLRHSKTSWRKLDHLPFQTSARSRALPQSGCF